MILHEGWAVNMSYKTFQKSWNVAILILGCILLSHKVY